MAGKPSAKLVFGMKVVLVTLAVLCVAWALISSDLRDTEGTLTGGACFLLSTSVALLLGALTLGKRPQAAGLWAALAVVGQAAFLHLIVAGPVVGYQHLMLQPRAHPFFWPALAVLALQTVLVAVRGAPIWRSALANLRTSTTPVALILAAVVLLASSAAISRNPSVYIVEVAFTTIVQLVALANVVLIVSAFPPDLVTRLTAWSTRWGVSSTDDAPEPGGIDRLALGCALWAAAVALLLNLLVYQRHPHIPDEVSYLWQARYFARGWLAMPAPPVPEAFNLDLMTYEPGRWYSPFPLGWPAGLAVGVWLGVPWLVNPLLTGVSLLLAFVFLREIYPLRTARLSVLLLALSPWFLFMGMSFMAHAFTLTFALAAAFCVARGRRTGKFYWAMFGGIAAGIVSLARPLDGLVVAGLLGCWWLLPRLRAKRLVSAAIFATLAAAVGALTLPYNRALTGNAQRHPVMDYFDRLYGPGVNDLGFGANRGVGWTGLDPFPGHGWKDVLVNAQLNAASINVDLFGWTTGSLILLCALIALGRRFRPSDGLMAVAALGVIALQSLYWFSGGPDIGARYWYLLIVPCVALSARALEKIAELMRTKPWLTRAAAPAVWSGAALLCVLAVINFLPWRALDKYHHYRSMRPDIRSLARTRGFDNGLVLIRGKRHPDYASAATYNPIDWTGPGALYAWDRDAEVRKRVVQAFPQRPVWIVNGPTITGRGYEVLGGPYPPGTVVSDSVIGLAAGHDSTKSGK